LRYVVDTWRHGRSDLPAADGDAARFRGLTGIASLIGVIVNHVIVLFDLIEEMRAKGNPCEQVLRRCSRWRVTAALCGNRCAVPRSAASCSTASPCWI
jgi:hypothetical protein